MEKDNTSDWLNSSGIFASVPEAFPTADVGVKNSIKVEFGMRQSKEGALQPQFSTTVALLDFAAVDAASIDAEKIIQDCEILKNIALDYPDELPNIVRYLQSGTEEGIRLGNELVQRMGLTEENSVLKGGGFFFTAIIVGGALLLASCGGANRQKVTSPAATTTPKAPRPSGDAGPDGG